MYTSDLVVRSTNSTFVEYSLLTHVVDQHRSPLIDILDHVYVFPNQHYCYRHDEVLIIVMDANTTDTISR
jgi:hypothetical protein